MLAPPNPTELACPPNAVAPVAALAPKDGTGALGCGGLKAEVNDEDELNGLEVALLAELVAAGVAVLPNPEPAVAPAPNVNAGALVAAEVVSWGLLAPKVNAGADDVGVLLGFAPNTNVEDPDDGV